MAETDTDETDTDETDTPRYVCNGCDETFNSALVYGGHKSNCGGSGASDSTEGTIKLPREDFTRHNERRKELGLTWREYIDGEAPSVDGVDEDVRAQLDRIENATTSTEERVAALERQLEDLQR